MRNSRFTEKQMVAVIREANRDGVPAVAKQEKVNVQTVYTWTKRFGTSQPDDVRRPKQLEQENVRLKKLVAERDLKIEVMEEIAAKNGERGAPSGASDVCGTQRRFAAAGLRAD